MNKINAPTVKKWIQDEGIDLVRIADAQNMILSYPPRPASALMPSARSTIIMAVTSSGFKLLSPIGFREWPGYIRMVRQHLKRRDYLVEMGQTYTTDVDNCIECMRVCPVGESWNKIRPKLLPTQKTNGSDSKYRSIPLVN